MTKIPECPENPIRKRGRGRPPASPDGFKYVLRLAQVGITDADIKKRLGITDRTWFRWLADGDNRQLLAQAKSRAVSVMDEALWNAAMSGKVAALNALRVKLMYNRKPWQR